VTLVDNSLAELPVTDEKFDIIVASGDFFAGMAEEEKERTFARVFVLARNINCLVWIQDNPDWGNDLDLILSAGDACSAIGYRMSNDSLSEAVFPGEAVMKAYRVGKQISNPIVRSYYPVSSRLTDAFIALSNETRNITGTKDSELKELMIERNRKRTALAREVMVRFDPPSLIQAFLALQNLVSEEKQFEWEPLAFPVETGAPRSVIDHILGMGVISDADVALTLRNLTAHHEKHGIPRDKINGRFIRDHFDCAIEILLEGRADLSAIDQEMMNNIRRNLMDEVNSVIINALFEMRRQYEVNAVDDYFMRRAALREAQSQV
ncbi:MAG: hypothetical protein ABH825_04715, partial [Candidatus Omnitrophota bacterium]